MSDKPKKTQAADLLTRDQAVLVDEVKLHHDGARKGYEAQMRHAYLAGVNLLLLKESVPHGNKNGDGFVALREHFLPELSNSAAARYMDFVRLASKNPTVGDFRNYLQLSDGRPVLPEAHEKTLLDNLYEAADGKTWTNFYRDLGWNKHREKGGFHPPTEDLRAWLKQHHHTLLTLDGKHLWVGNHAEVLTFAALNSNFPDLAAAFKKQWKPKAIPSDVVAEGHRREGRKLLVSIHEALDDKKRTAAWDDDLRSDLKTAAFDLWKAMKASLKGRKPKRTARKS